MKQKYNSQIMLTTLITISLLIIFLTTIMTMLRSDIRQVLYNTNYSNYYTVSDSVIAKIINDISNKEILSENLIFDSVKEFTTEENNVQILCNLSLNSCFGKFLPNKILNNKNVYTEISIRELSYLDNYEIFSDEVFQFKIHKTGQSDYRGKIDVTLDKGNNQGLIEIGVLGRDNFNYLRIWRDFIDIDNLSSTPKLQSILPITNVNINESEISFSIDMNFGISNLSRNDLFLTDVIIIPRLKPIANQQKLTVSIKKLSFRDYSSVYEMPSIAREIMVSTKNLSVEDSSVTLKTNIPIQNQILSIFDYVLFTEENIINIENI